jgi:hypothetical protein
LNTFHRPAPKLKVVGIAEAPNPNPAELPLVADLRLCRDRWQMLRHATGVGPAIVVIARRPRLLGIFPRPEDWLARKLAKTGHHVVRTVALHKELS